MATVFASSDRAPATYTSDFTISPGGRGTILHVNYTAEGGAGSTLDLKLQYYDSVAATWEDLPGASIVQLGAVGEIDLMVYPGIAAIANRQVSIGCPRKLRCVAVVGTTNVTFSVSSTDLL